MTLADWLDYQADVLDGIAAGVADDRQRDRLTRAAGTLCRRALVAELADAVLAGELTGAEARACYADMTRDS